MNNLYNELTTSTSNTNANGEVTTHPPSNLSLRAAREIKMLNDQLTMAQEHSNACQHQAFELSQQLTLTQNQVKELHAELQSLRESTKPASPVDSGGGDLSGSDSGSTGNDSSQASSGVN